MSDVLFGLLVLIPESAIAAVNTAVPVQRSQFARARMNGCSGSHRGDRWDSGLQGIPNSRPGVDNGWSVSEGYPESCSLEYLAAFHLV
jgi:hypothetical protein